MTGNTTSAGAGGAGGDAFYDYVVVGAGMGGLTVGALLAHAGARVCVVEAHEYPGGCCHTFPMGEHYRFCAAVHYIFSCGEGEPVYNLLRKLGLHEAITFERLDPEGYDHFRCPSAHLHFRIPNGLSKWRDRLCDRFPGERDAIRRFFDVVLVLAQQIDRIPDDLSPLAALKAVASSPLVLQVVRYRRHTLQQLFDEHHLSAEVQAIVSTQLGDVGLPPRDVSLLIWIALVARYGDGAYYPTEHFASLVEGVARTITSAPGCAIAYNTAVDRVVVDGGRITAVTSADGREFRARHFICNADPQWFVATAGRKHFSPEVLDKIDYAYSASSFSVYLGVRGIDLREHGFGNWNVWHYPRLDINDIYAAQHDRGDLSDPWLFMSTPTLCSPRAKTRHAPEGEQILELITTCAYAPFEEARARGLRDYTEMKNAVRDRIIDVVEQHYVPGLRAHLAMKVAGTPTTNRRYLWAPHGNIYGSALTPKHVDAGRLDWRSSLENLSFTGASASFPSIGGTVGGGERLYTALTGDPVNPARDRRPRHR